MYTKNDCVLCDLAKELLRVHNLERLVRIEKRTSLYQVMKEIGTLDNDDVSSFPVFYANNETYNIDRFFQIYGEPLLNINPDRHVVFPIRYPDMWDMYEKALASFWTVSEIDFSQDESQFDNLTENEQKFIKNILAFFASSDGIVNENLARNFSDEVQVPEARAFYSYQQFNETIHSHTYSLMIDRYVKNNDEKAILLRGVHTIPSVGKKAEWALKWINKSECPCFAKRLVAFACVEGIMFSGSFCAIFWLKKRGLMHGLSFSNELIARDEGTHQDFAVLLFKHLRNKPPQSEIEAIVKEAVEHEKEFINESIPCRLVGMNETLMSQYIEYVADRILLQLGYSAVWHTSNPFDFMENISLTGKTNFFERRVGEYAKAGVMQGHKLVNEANQFGTDGDF
jgi:ribonucleotide reductase beta subunit family protein with ferritin-like domain/glutaredoxin